MVKADVEKAGGGELGTQSPVVFQGLAGYLHGEILHPRFHPVGKVALELQRFGCGEVGLEPLHPVIGVNGGDDAALRLLPLGHILIQDIFQIVGGRGLPLGARQADDLQLSGGVTVEQVGQGSDGRAHIMDLKAGQVTLGIGDLAHIGQRPSLLGHFQKFRLKVGSLAKKQGTGDHLSGVVRHQSHRGGLVYFPGNGGG